MSDKLHDTVEIDDLIKELQKAKKRGITNITDISTDVRTSTYIYGGDRICGIGFWNGQEKGCIFVPFTKYKEEIKVKELIDTFRDMAKRGTLLARGGVTQEDLLIQIIGTITNVAMR